MENLMVKVHIFSLVATVMKATLKMDFLKDMGSRIILQASFNIKGIGKKVRDGDKA
jgi:hypothetical protein